MLEELFFEIGIVFIIVAAASMLIYRLKLPLILAYIVTGVVIGPSLLALTKSSDVFHVMSQIGIAFLLFTVGLGLNWRNVKDVGGVSFATGIGQVIFTTIIGFGFSSLLGFSPLTSLYLAVAFTFASTIIVVKSLTDKEDTDSLYGRISIGFLLVQDFIAMILLLILNAMKTGAPLEQVFIGSLLKAILLVPLLWLVSAKLLPPILHGVAKSQELLFVFAIGWCFMIALILSKLGFGIELGALIAGITLSGSFYQREITTRIRPLRDFFLILFFIVLGTQFHLEGLSDLILPIVSFTLFILIGNPLIVMLVMRLLGYHQRTGFLAGTTVAQISEFSFIIIGAGIASGHLSPDMLGLVTAVGILTIAGSSLLIQYNERIFDAIHPIFRWLEPKQALGVEMKKVHKPVHTVLFGFHRTGSAMLETIQNMKKSFSVIDFDPQVIYELSECGISSIYGDAGDENFLEDVQVDKAKLVISTIPDVAISSTILMFLQSKNYKGTVIVSARQHEEAERCYELGATYVIVPSILSGKKMSELLEKTKMNKSIWQKLHQQFSSK
jgi:Kef-type K+ transport system membrane component KefB/voltage-gated potassium channel Kch